jgi:hypothetical protein
MGTVKKYKIKKDNIDKLIIYLQKIEKDVKQESK